MRDKKDQSDMKIKLRLRGQNNKDELAYRNFKHDLMAREQLARQKKEEEDWRPAGSGAAASFERFSRTKSTTKAYL